MLARKKREISRALTQKTARVLSIRLYMYTLDQKYPEAVFCDTKRNLLGNYDRQLETNECIAMLVIPQHFLVSANMPKHRRNAALFFFIFLQTPDLNHGWYACHFTFLSPFFFFFFRFLVFWSSLPFLQRKKQPARISLRPSLPTFFLYFLSSCARDGTEIFH